MKIYFRLINDWAAEMQLANTGIAIEPEVRVVCVELTPEQIKVIKPKEVGRKQYGSNEMATETLRFVCIQE